MNLSDTTDRMRASGLKALVPFFTAGYPDEETFLALVAAAVRAGCRVVEIGIPFSDPIADGPVIQASSEAALARGMTLSRALALTRRASTESVSTESVSTESTKSAVSICAMGYLNPIMRMGIERFARTAAESGVEGVIIPDLPIEESDGPRQALARESITLVDLVALTSSPKRLAAISSDAEGFLYLVALTGVTGSSAADPGVFDAFVDRVRSLARIPLYAGFGIATPEHAVRAAVRADGVIIGSALIRIIDAAPSPEAAVEKVEEFLHTVQEAINPPKRSRQR